MTKAVRSLAVVAGIVLLLGIAGRASADQFDMTWTGGYGPGDAVLTATDEGGGIFLVTDISGTQNGTSIDALLGPGSFGANDDLIFPGSSPQLDILGLDFSSGGVDYNLFFYLGGTNLYTECSSTFDGACISGDELNGAPSLTSFAITPVGTPEPGSLTLLLLGVLAVCVAAGIKRRAAAKMAA